MFLTSPRFRCKRIAFVHVPAVVVLLACERDPSVSPPSAATDTLPVITVENPAEWYDDVQVAGEMEPERLSQILREIGDSAAAQDTGVTTVGQKRKPYEYTDHAFGFIPINNTNDTVAILSANQIVPDSTLMNQKIRIALDRLRVLDYPGSGEHRVLFDFYAQNQVQGQTEHVHFNQVYRAMEGSAAGIVGYPVFVGLGVSGNGVSFKMFTVNVENKNTKNFLEFLDSDVAKQGLSFVGSLNPAIPALSSFVVGVTKMVVGSKHNVPVQDAFIGLDFQAGGTGARLAQGSYIVVQVPDDNAIQWSDWVYLRQRGVLRKRSQPDADIPFNYIVFRISKHQ
jgi:hypothetical protein